MTLKIKDNKNDITKYKLYRNIHEIIHPTISKKNISNYKIILEEYLYPVLIFYPEKVSKINKIIIYIHGDEDVTETFKEYDNICRKLSLETDSLIISIDYNEDSKFNNLINNCHKVVKYLIKELEKEGIAKSQIILMGDSTGATIISNYSDNLNKILFYPPVKGNYLDLLTLKNNNTDYNYKTINKLHKYFNKRLKNNEIFPLSKKTNTNEGKTLIIIGTQDPLYLENLEYFDKLHKLNNKNEILKLEFLGHGFLKTIDEDNYQIIISKINEFVS